MKKRGQGQDPHVPVMSQPSGLWIWVGYSHLNLKENGRDTVTWEPTVGSKEVHADRPSPGNMTATSLCSYIMISTRKREEESMKKTVHE